MQGGQPVQDLVQQNTLRDKAVGMDADYYFWSPRFF